MPHPAINHPRPTPPKLIVFDLGRVLVRICDDLAHACSLAKFTPPATHDAAALRDLSHAHDRGTVLVDDFCQQFATLMSVTPADARRLSDRFILGPYDGATDLLHDLLTTGIPTACLSNTNDNHWALLSHDPYPLHLLTHRFASHLVGYRKPDPHIYEHLERETGVAGSDILFFDDLPENTAAAAARGWRAHTVPVIPNPIPWIRARLVAEGALP